MLTSPGRALRAVTIAAALALAAGCTSDDPSATPSSSAGTTSEAAPSQSTSDELPATGELFRAARTAALAAESARIEGSLERQGKAFEVEVEGTAGGSNQELFLVVDGGGRAEVLTVGDEYWLGGDEAFWVEQTGDAEAGKAMVGRYVPIAESDAKELGSFTLRSILTDEFSDPAIAAIETSSEPVLEQELDGEPVYVLSGADGAELTVAADGSATLLRLVGPTDSPADLAFTRWGRVDTFTAPPASAVVDEG